MEFRGVAASSEAPLSTRTTILSDGLRLKSRSGFLRRDRGPIHATFAASSRHKSSKWKESLGFGG